jgi:hypothetical protein
VAGWFVCSGGGFRVLAGEMVCDAVGSVHHGAGRGWRWVVRSMPCSYACGTGLEEACVHGNVRLALGALGGQIMSRWHGQGALHGRPRVQLAWGIDHPREEGLDGEVTR